MRVVVVGGGLAGLFTASELIAAGMSDVIVVEKSDTPGGVARTIRRDGFTLEPAVGALTLPHPDLSPILERLDVEMLPADAAAAVRQVYANGDLISFPASPRAALAPLVSWPARLRAMAEPLIPARDLPDEGLADFCRRRFGRRAGEMIAWLMASGVYAGDPERLSVESAFPVLSDLERGAGSVIRGAMARRRQREPGVPRPRLHYPPGGMAAVAQHAAEAVGDRYLGGFEVESVRRESEAWLVTGPETLRADSVVLATSPGRAADLVDAQLATHLRGSTSAPVVVVGMGGSGADVLPDGFGALIGPGEDMVTRGLLYESSYAPERAPEGSWLLKAIAGGSPMGGVVDGVAEIVREEAETVLGKKLSPTFLATVEHLPGIPQYEIGHHKWLHRLDELLRDRAGLHVTGWGYRGVGLTHLATDAVRLREAVSGR